MVEWIEANFQTFNISNLRSEFLEEGEEPQTSIEESHVIEIEDEAQEEEAKVQEVVPSAVIHFVPPPPPTYLARPICNIFLFIL